jgi:hypothetical protein
MFENLDTNLILYAIAITVAVVLMALVLSNMDKSSRNAYKSSKKTDKPNPPTEIDQNTLEKKYMALHSKVACGQNPGKEDWDEFLAAEEELTKFYNDHQKEDNK